MADEYEKNISSLNFPRVLLSNEASKNRILIQIGMQGSLRNGSMVPEEHLSKEDGFTTLAGESDLNSGAILIQIDGRAIPPGVLKTPPLQHDTLGILAVAPGAAPPEPIDDKVQTQIKNGAPNAESFRHEFPLYAGGLTGSNAIEEINAISTETLNRQKMTESSLLIAGQVFVTLLTAWLGNANNPPSRNAKILRDFAVGSTIVGYISSFSSILMCKLKTGLVARILYTVACAGAAFGFLATIGMLLPDELKLWITFISCAVCFPALASVFRE
ncbi:uncharacterized protein LOC126664888 [Mercurialis annua]|uniref:uncharacterized protein LOC126664888 n=1 Tax=Mercurialis annua TaxID=3986 RepID=UPI0021607496|nr:uncharacterized protein LOC126664888 [Mercurialis annua]